MEGASSDSMMKQAQKIWTMLDDMADNDPKAYKKFIDKQNAERNEFLKPPEPHMCVQTSMVKPEKATFFINFCKWKRIPSPSSPEEACKVAGSAIGQLTLDQKGKAAVTAVAFSEKVLDDYGKGAANSADRDTLIQIAMDFIEKQHSHVKLNRNYKVLERVHMGNLKVVQDSLQQAFAAKDKTMDDNLSDVMNNFAPLATDNPTSLLQQLSSENGNNDETGIGEKIQGIKLNSEMDKNAKCLIEEVSSTSMYPEPKHELGETIVSGIKSYVLTISLPGVKSVAECELDISEDDVSLWVADKYDLKLALPHRIDDSEAKAKFNKKTSVLTLTMPFEAV